MSTTLQSNADQNPLETPAERLEITTAAVRLSLSWLVIRKSLSSDQKTQAADAFGAEERFLSAGKKLLDNRHPAFQAVTAVRHRIVSYFKSMSLPYPEAGVRLIRQDRVDEFHARMHEFRAELQEAVGQLEERYADLRAAAQRRLGSLYNPADYPENLAGLFAVHWDFPSVEPPDYLRQLNPQLYRQECRRVQERFDEAVRLAEEAFTEELASLVSHLAERLSGQADGRPKVFRDSTVENLSEFFQRFGSLNVSSSQQLDRLVADAQRVIRGVQPQALRDNRGLRQHVVTELARVQSVLDGLLVDRPRRNILRRPR